MGYSLGGLLARYVIGYVLPVLRCARSADTEVFKNPTPEQVLRESDTGQLQHHSYTTRWYT
jgi:hypothetical protein